MGIPAPPVGSADAGNEVWNLPAGAEGRAAGESPVTLGMVTGPCPAPGRLSELDLFFLFSFHSPPL